MTDTALYPRLLFLNLFVTLTGWCYLQPTRFPSRYPTASPTKKPTRLPVMIRTTRRPTTSPTARPTTRPTAKPVTPSPTTCEGRKWHYASSINGCANTGDVAEGDALYASRDECCATEFGAPCESHDVCATPEPTPPPTRPPSRKPSAAPTSCEGRKWFVASSKIVLKQCRNGYDVPPGADATYFDTLQACCEDAFGFEQCNYEDVCAEPTPKPTPPPTPEPTPNPSPKPVAETATAEPTPEPTTPAPTRCEEVRPWRPNDDGTACTNRGEKISNDFPSASDKFDTLQECCQELFGAGAKCDFEDVCAPETPDPTPAPTSCEARTWHFNDDEKVCDNRVQENNDSTPGYGSLEECCEEIFGMSSENSGEAVTCPSGAIYDECCESTYPTWYWIPSLKLCSNEPVLGGAPPDLIYENLPLCCADRFDDPDFCPIRNICYPTLEPTPSPTRMTPLPTFGSTPTVSKETSGPPTITHDRTERMQQQP